jgi:ABC-type branched-subunit amino acid transport system ATPase component
MDVRGVISRSTVILSVLALLDVTALEVSYGHLQVLFGVSITVEAGEVVALLGTNGAGKSTLLRALTNLQPPSRGHVLFDGQDLSGISPDEVARRGLILVEGGRAAFPSLTVDENLRLGAYPILNRDRAEVASRVDHAYSVFPALATRRGQHAGMLSGGEQQMMALGRALVARPRLLMIDELSLGLAPVVLQQLVAALQRMVADGITVLLVEQSLNVAMAVAKRAYFLEKGEVKFSGTPAELIDRGDLVRSVFFGARQVAKEVVF